MIESAPLHITLIWPFYMSLKTEVMRFLVELNSIVVSSSYERVSSPLKLIVKMLLSLASLPVYVRPRKRAPLTKASSSGEEAL